MKKNTTTALLVFVGALYAASAHALVITNNMQATVSARSYSHAPVVKTGSSATELSLGATDTLPPPSDRGVVAEAVGYPSGHFFTWNEGNGKYDSISNFIYTWNITNDSADAQSLNFNSVVTAGTLNVDNYQTFGSGSAEFAIHILQNDITALFDSTALVNNGGLATTGSALNGALYANYDYTWTDTAINLDLGFLAAGASTKLTYSLTSRAFGAFESSFPLCDSPFEDDTTCDGPSYPPREGRSSVHIGDPANFGSGMVPFAITGTPFNHVPEPDSVALLGLGALGFLSARRRKFVGLA